MSETLWTCIARCSICERELNRAEHVPESKKSKVAMSAPLAAICPVREHNTFSDLNLRTELEWVREDTPQSKEGS